MWTTPKHLLDDFRGAHLYVLSDNLRKVILKVNDIRVDGVWCKATV